MVLLSKSNKTNNLLLIFSIVLLFTGFKSTAQFSDEYFTYKNKYKNASLVRLKSEKKINISLEGPEIEIIQEIKNEDLYLNAAAIYNSKQSIDYSSFYELNDIKAASYIFNGSSYDEIKVTEFRKKDEFGDSFYDDIKSINFIYPNLNEGAKSSISYKEKIKNPRFLNSFYFGLSFPIVNNKIIIEADKEISMAFKEFNMDNIDVKFSKKQKRNKNIYTWEFYNAKAYEIDNNAPNYRTVFPHVIPIIKSYKVDNKTIKLSESTGDLYSWYHSLVKDINTEKGDPELIEIVQKLTADKKTELEKVKAIYYWVQKNIKYIAFEYALGGFIPREANAVYKKKYGDCKDNSSILYEMMEIAGIKGNLTWIGTRSIPYKYDEVPTPVVDNHMILSYTAADNKTYYLDATGRYIPINLPSSFIQGKEALVGIDENNYDIREIPIVSSDINNSKDSVYLKLDGNSIKGTGIGEFSGYAKIDLFNRLESLRSEIKTKEFYNGYFQKGSNKFLIDDFEEIDKFDYDKNFKVTYNFNLTDYTVKADNELYINLNLINEFERLKTEEDRKSALEIPYKFKNEYTFTLEIPENMEVSYLPENLNIDQSFFKSTITYAKQDNTVVYHHILDINFIELNIEDTKALNKLIKKIEKAYKEIIVLTEK